MTAQLVTIFGGSGFVGRYLVQRLARRGYRVRVAVRDPEAALYLKPQGVVGQVTPVQANVRSDESVQAATHGSDHVVNLVGVLYPSGGNTFEAIHTDAAGRIAAASREAGVTSVIQMSAIGADPNSAAQYARTKSAGETAAAAAFPGTSIVRPSVVFGPEDGLFNRFARMASLIPILPLIDGGKTRFQPVYVCDVADAMANLIDQPTLRGATYELGGPRIYTFKEMLQLLVKEIRRDVRLINLPSGIASLEARFLELLPKPLLTRDQLLLLQQDNVVANGAKGLAELGISAAALEAVLPTYLAQYRPSGRWNFKLVDRGA